MTDRRIAVVTGAAGGMGRAIVARLLGDGCHVVGVDIDAAAVQAMAVDLDHFSPEAVDLTDPVAIAKAPTVGRSLAVAARSPRRCPWPLRSPRPSRG